MVEFAKFTCRNRIVMKVRQELLDWLLIHLADKALILRRLVLEAELE